MTSKILMCDRLFVYTLMVNVTVHKMVSGQTLDMERVHGFICENNAKHLLHFISIWKTFLIQTFFLRITLFGFEALYCIYLCFTYKNFFISSYCIVTGKNF